MRYEIKFVGSGGQGVITAAIVIAEAAANSGFNVTQMQDYGPEARGGLCSSEAIISTGAISFPMIERPNILVLLTQEACDMYSPSTGRDCTILTDLTLSAKGAAKIISLPIFSTTDKTPGKNSCVNMLTVGALNRLWNIVPEQALLLAVKRHLPRNFWDSSIAACIIGAELARNMTLC